MSFFNKIKDDINNIYIGPRTYSILKSGRDDTYLNLRDVTVVNYSDVPSGFTREIARTIFNSYKDIDSSTGNYQLKFTDNVIKRLILEECMDTFRRCSQYENLKMTKIYKAVRGICTSYDYDSISDSVYEDVFKICDYYLSSKKEDGTVSELDKKNVFNLICIIGEKHGEKSKKQLSRF